MRSVDSLQNDLVKQGVVDSLLGYVHTDSIWYPSLTISPVNNMLAINKTILNHSLNYSIPTGNQSLNGSNHNTIWKSRQLMEYCV